MGPAPSALYVSDLDGTLLLPDGTLGERTVAVVNELFSAGGLFSYATARGYESAKRVTGRRSARCWRPPKGPARRSPSCSPATAPMFALADEALAVANALDEVKRSATGVIDANAAEGVAAWLAAHVLG